MIYQLPCCVVHSHVMISAGMMTLIYFPLCTVSATYSSRLVTTLCDRYFSCLPVVLCVAVLAQTSDIAELLTDYQIDLLRALEMSRLQFLREIGSLRPGTSERQGRQLLLFFFVMSVLAVGCFMMCSEMCNSSS